MGGETLLDIFSHDEYIRLIGLKKNLWDEPEEKYKDKFIPSMLYKYWSFTSQHIEENLKNLCEGKIWMPIACTLNDPFEFQMLSDKLEEQKRIEFRVDTLGRNSILSLCDSCNNNLLWAHYGYGHSGLCIEFEVERKDQIFPITYCQDQIDITDDIEQWLSIKKEVISKKPEMWNANERCAFGKVQKIMFYKHCDWKYEKEYRIIGRDICSSSEEDGKWSIKPGFWADLHSYCGIKVKQIILGFNCSLQNKARVIDIVNKHNKSVLMAEMAEYDFIFPISEFIEKIYDRGDFISIAQMVRINNSLELVRKELQKKEVYLYE